MTDEPRFAHLVISVDLADPSACQNPNDALSSQRRLVDLFAAYELPATWAVGSAAGLAQVQNLLVRRDFNDEIALLADASWASEEAGRTVFARELSSRVETARDLGLPLATLAVRDGELGNYLDLLVRYRLGIVRGAPRNLAPGANFEPCSTRFGIWRTPEPVLVPASRGWWPGFHSMRLGHQLQLAVLQRSLLHVLVDGVSLATESRAAWNAIDRALNLIRRRLDQGQLIVHSLAGFASRQLLVRRAILVPPSSRAA